MNLSGSTVQVGFPEPFSCSLRSFCGHSDRPHAEHPFPSPWHLDASGRMPYALLMASSPTKTHRIEIGITEEERDLRAGRRSRQR